MSGGKDFTLNETAPQWLDGQDSGAAEPAVLIADDSEADIFFLRRAFEAAGLKNPIYVAHSGTEAIEYLSGIGGFGDRQKYPMPRVVFMDLKMPKPDGFDVLRWKEAQADLPRMLWVAISSFDGVKTINEAYTAGATTFLAKPLDAMDVRNLVDAFQEFWTVSLVGKVDAGAALNEHRHG